MTIVRKPKTTPKAPRLLYLVSLVSLATVLWQLGSTTSRQLSSPKNQESPSSPQRRINTHYPQKWEFPVDTTTKEVASSSRNLGKGRHVCTCLPDDDEEEVKRTPGNFRWVHIPKTGTSFIITLWLYATSALDSRLPARTIDPSTDQYFRKGCEECYDFTLMQRYPLELFSHQMKKRRPFASLHTSHQPLGKIRPDHWNTTQQLIFLREPHARAVSAFDNDMHSYGNPKEYGSIKKICEGNVTCYAARPGQMGCMTRMLTEATCSVAADSPHAISLDRMLSKDQDVQARLERAKNILAGMAFLGLTEEWNESLCRFHQQFGGQPIQEQFQNVRLGSKKSSVSDLSPTYQDPLDEDLYQFAVEEFKRRQVGDQKCYQYIPPEEDTTSQSCVPKTCQELNKQCGEWADGCGGVRICGICSMELRDGLPDTWRLQCSPEGQCLRTCPPWEEAGLWHRPVLAENHNNEVQLWKTNLHGAPKEIVETATKAEFLSPTDAVRMCVGACNTAIINEDAKAFASTYCTCGSDPEGFLKVSPAAEDYRDVYNLKPSVKIPQSKPFAASLGKEETQPKCCPPKSGKKPPAPWKKGIPVADYFETYYLGCGASQECEQLGREHNATVVSFDGDNHYCYLGRGQGSSPNDVLDDIRCTRYHLVLHSSEEEGTK